jgi:predicted nucleic acid-binding Zn ribbon protein
MRVIYDARCTSCGNVDEVFGKKGDAVRCTVCSSESQALISPVRCSLDGTSGDFPGAAIKWARDHERRAN